MRNYTPGGPPGAPVHIIMSAALLLKKMHPQLSVMSTSVSRYPMPGQKSCQDSWGK